MAVAHGSQLRVPISAPDTGVFTTTRSESFTPASTPRGVVVVVCSQASADQGPWTITYGAASVPLTPVCSAVDTSEAGRIDIFFLGSGIPTGTQTVTITSTGAATKFATVSTVTAANDTEVDSFNVKNTTTATNPNVIAATTTGRTTQGYGGLHTGHAAINTDTTPGTGMTRQHFRDYGALGATTARRTSVDTGGNVTHAHTAAVSEDHCLAAVHIGEITATTVARVSLAAGSTPTTQTSHNIKARVRKTSGVGAVTFSAALYEGATNRSGDLTTAALTTSLADYTLAIPDASAANITDYSNLELRFWGNSPTGDTVSVEVAEIWLETPAAASGPANLPLQTSAATSNATLALSAATTIPLGASPAQSDAALALRAPTQVPLQTSAGQSNATLAVSIPTGAANVPLGTAAATSTAALALTAQTTIPLGTSPAQSAATLAFRAPTQVPLQASPAQSNATLALATPARVTLGAAAAQSNATLALRSQTQVPLQASIAQSAATLAVTIPGAGTVPLAPAVATSTGTLALRALTQVPLGLSAVISSGTLALRAQTRIPLGSSAALSNATLALRAATRIALGSSPALSDATLLVFAPTVAFVPLSGSAATSSTGVLALSTIPPVPLGHVEGATSTLGIEGSSVTLSGVEGSLTIVGMVD